MGVSEFQKSNFAAAENWFSQSISLYNKNSFSSQAYLWRGECYYRAGEPEKAQRDINTFLESPQRKTANQLYNAYYTIEGATIGFDQNNVATAINNLQVHVINDTITKMNESMASLREYVDNAWVDQSAEIFKENMEFEKTKLLMA